MSDNQFRLDSPIFIGGSGSSGNTLLARMFGRHPAVHCSPEMSLFNKREIYGDFTRLKRSLRGWLQWGVPTRGYSQYFKILPPAEGLLLTKNDLLIAASQADSPRNFADRIQTLALQRSGKIVFAEKTPSDVYCFSELAALYPNCLLVHCIRDGRDVICSLMSRGYNVFEASSIWLYNTACGIGCRDLPNYIEVRYEELVSNPESVLRVLCDKAGVDFDPCMLRPKDGEKASKFAVAGSWKSSTSDPINQSSVGRYNRDLSPENSDSFCRVCLTPAGARNAGVQALTARELLCHLGYATSRPASRKLPYKVRLLAAYVILRSNLHLLRKGYGPRRALTKFASSPNASLQHLNAVQNTAKAA